MRFAEVHALSAARCAGYGPGRMPRFTVTTALRPTNDAPHLGSAYAMVAADALSRWHRLRGDEARLLGPAGPFAALDVEATAPPADADAPAPELLIVDRAHASPAAGAPAPKRTFVLGALALHGAPIGEATPPALRAAVDARELVQAFGSSAIRWYLLREFAFGQDGDVSHAQLVARYDVELADTLGNLLGRTLGLCAKLRPGASALDASAGGPLEAKLEEVARVAAAGVAAGFEELAPHRAIDSMWGLAKAANKYVDEAAPWAEAKKGEAGRARVDAILATCLEVLRWLSVLVWPVIPAASDRMRAQLGLPSLSAPSGREGADQTALAFVRGWRAGEGGALAAGTPVFPKLDAERQAELFASLGLEPRAPRGDVRAEAEAAKRRGHEKKPVPEPAAEIGFDELSRLDLRIGRVVSAARIPRSEKLLKLEVDLGDGAPRQVVAGIGKSYAPEALVGQQVTMVANLKPVTLMGIESRGMVLAVGGGAGDADLALLQPSKARTIGTRVT